MEYINYFVLSLPECTFSITYTESAYNILKIMPFSFDSAGDQTQGLMHARQVLYHSETTLVLKSCLFFFLKQTKHAHLWLL